MTRSRFIVPQTDSLTLANGDTLIVRRRLNVAEQRESYRACSVDVETEDGGWRTRPIPLLVGPAKVAAYLVDWFLAGDDPEATAIRGLDFAQRFQVIDNLTDEDFYEMKEAIDAHEARQTAARLAEKNGQGGQTSAPAILPSPSDAAGASIGSEP